MTEEQQKTGQEMGLMTHEHPQWDDFIDRLSGPEGCNFRLAVPGNKDSLTWTCDSDGGYQLSTQILASMGLRPDEIEESMSYFHENGGSCDCEILFNVAVPLDSPEESVESGQ